MTSRSHRRSPLALVLLVLLAEEPMHPYRMRDLIRERGKDKVANVAQRNSVYQTVERLERVGLIRVQGVKRGEGRPDRTVYELTPEGSRTMVEWLTAMLSAPVNEFPEFPAALASMVILTPEDVAACLAARADALERELADIEADLASVPRVFLLEDEYRFVIGRAEVEWLRGVVADLRSGELGWTHEWLRTMLNP
ncbi:PadR family transcriptional regulator [Actinokineospora iranica]|uniref:DNA-binding transcriptional regulator, PadR family n=1 Tax=Actinokineospora iranica TaxID=1271860 RepID=A0A1G6QGK2_9PSEU|nr:PadR family transcriptional regulator [Actinokineospora iranica]SDC91602.1 DNA-binding transcriptional regulator, PadR family [Actinokineospora iranica]